MILHTVESNYFNLNNPKSLLLCPATICPNIKSLFINTPRLFCTRWTIGYLIIYQGDKLKNKEVITNHLRIACLDMANQDNEIAKELWEESQKET